MRRQPAMTIERRTTIENTFPVLYYSDCGGVRALAQVDTHHVTRFAGQEDRPVLLFGFHHAHSGSTSGVKAAAMMAAGKTASSGSKKASSYSSLKRMAPSSFSSSARNSFEMRG